MRPLIRLIVRLRENFVERVFAWVRLRDLFAPRWTVGALVRFHTAHKTALLAHSPDIYRQMGRLVAGAKGVDRAVLERDYRDLFMRALAMMATTRKHTNVLMHMAGYFKEHLPADERRELLTSIDDYRQGLLPLVVPLTLIRHHVRKYGVDYLGGQVYLGPHPKELMLRNHV